MEREMGHEDIQDLLGAYALDAVEADEAELVARHVDTCPRCRSELQEHREVAGLLGYAGEDAPPGLWDRIAASTQEAPPELRLQRLPADMGPAGGQIVGIGAARSGRARRSGALRTRAGVALGAAAAVVIGVLGVQVVRLDHRTTTIGNAVAAPGPTMRAVELALSVPGARKVTLSPGGTGQSVDAVVLPGGQGYLYDAKLTPLAPAQTYQLWGVHDGQTISYGILGNALPQVVGFRAGPGVRALAITAEAAGGVEHTVHAPVVSGAVTPPL